MAYFPIKLPPGIVRNGTEYGSKGRYYDAWHTRWNDDGTLKPTGGFRTRGASSVSGKARCLFPWKTNTGLTYIAIGTHTKLYVQNRAGTLYDITPTSFTTGRADAVAAGGYGTGLYGVGTYGTPRADSALIAMATQWTLDNWGEYLVGVSPEDGIINQWALNTGTPAGPITGGDTPPTCKAIVVTAEGFLFALSERTVTWCDQRDNTTWIAAATNQAGDYELQTAGSLMCGKVVKGGTLLFTDLDVHLATYIGGTLVYSFDKMGSACGIISRQAVAVIDSQAVWMSKSGFWIYNGYVQPLNCDVQDYVYSDINVLQASKTYAVRDSANSEIQFFYCSASATEIDRCVVWNYKSNWWTIGRVERTCGADRGVFTYPIFVDSAGQPYEHEVGLDFDDEDTPFAEAGPLEIANGDQVFRVKGIVPDEKTSGDTELTFFGKFFPNGTEEEFGPYTMDEKVDVRFTARQAKIRITGLTSSDWRFGSVKLEGDLGGRR